MAANRFATMLHRNTNKITVILIYAVLEWILIFLLLLNSLFSYIIIKFAHFFGLKPPCFWCTRIDHVFDPAKGGKNIHRDLLCESHCKEILRLGYCSNHRKLVDSEGMCKDCFSSSKNFALFPWMKEFGGMQKGVDFGVSLKCCCCGVCVDDDGGEDSSYILLKTSSWDVLECTQKENLIVDCDRVEEGFDDITEKILDSSADFGGNSVEAGEDEVERGWETVEEGKSVLVMKDNSVLVCVEEDEVPSQHLEFFLDYSGHTLVPIELVNSMTDEHLGEGNDRIEDGDEGNEREPLVLGREEKRDDAFLDVDINEEPTYTMLEVMEMEEDENSLVFHAKGSHFETVFPLARWPSVEANGDLEIAGASVEERSDERAGILQFLCFVSEIALLRIV